MHLKLCDCGIERATNRCIRCLSPVLNIPCLQMSLQHTFQCSNSRRHYTNSSPTRPSNGPNPSRHPGPCPLPYTSGGAVWTRTYDWPRTRCRCDLEAIDAFHGHSRQAAHLALRRPRSSRMRVALTAAPYAAGDNQMANGRTFHVTESTDRTYCDTCMGLAPIYSACITLL
jgi:hypothetical protein